MVRAIGSELWRETPPRQAPPARPALLCMDAFQNVWGLDQSPGPKPGVHLMLASGVHLMLAWPWLLSRLWQATEAVTLLIAFLLRVMAHGCCHPTHCTSVAGRSWLVTKQNCRPTPFVKRRSKWSRCGSSKPGCWRPCDSRRRSSSARFFSRCSSRFSTPRPSDRQGRPCPLRRCWSFSSSSTARRAAPASSQGIQEQHTKQASGEVLAVVYGAGMLREVGSCCRQGGAMESLNNDLGRSRSTGGKIDRW